MFYVLETSRFTELDFAYFIPGKNVYIEKHIKIVYTNTH